MENISKELLEKLVRQIIEEKLAGAGNNDRYWKPKRCSLY